MADDFFKENMDESTQDEPQKLKVGEKEYSQEDLTRLVGLGEIGAEAEEKYGVKIDKIWPNHQKTINEKIQLQTRLDEIEKSKVEAPSEQQLSEEQVRTQAKAELSKLGYLPKDEVQKMINDTVAGLRLTEHAQDVISKMTQDGYPSTNLEDLFNFMSDPANPKDPEKAYKLMFEREIDQVKEKKLASLKPTSFVTEGSSTAGSKEPAPQKVTSKNLGELLRAAIPD